MGLIQHLAEIYEQSRIEYEQQKSGAFRLIERLEAGNGEKEERGVGMLAYGDNAACMRWLLSEKELDGKVQLIYLDPPFFSKANYEAIAEIPMMSDKDAKAGSESEKATAKTRRVRHRAYEDVWETGMEAYLRMLCVRLLYMRDLLADEGTIWVHLDWHSVHYVKILLDVILSMKLSGSIIPVEAANGTLPENMTPFWFTAKRPGIICSCRRKNPIIAV